MRNCSRNNAKLGFLQHFESFRVNIDIVNRVIDLPKVFSLNDLLHHILLEAIPKNAICLSTSSLPIRKYCRVVSIKSAINTVLDLIENVSLTSLRIEDSVEIRL